MRKNMNRLLSYLDISIEKTNNKPRTIIALIDILDEAREYSKPKHTISILMAKPF